MCCLLEYKLIIRTCASVSSWENISHFLMCSMFIIASSCLLPHIHTICFEMLIYYLCFNSNEGHILCFTAPALHKSDILYVRVAQSYADSCTLILLVLILSALARVLPFPVACSFLTILLFFTSLCLTLHSLACPSSALLLFLHTAFFSLIALHLFLYPPTQHTDTAEGISLSHTLSPSLLSFFSLSVFLLICLPPSLSLPPSLTLPPFLPPCHPPPSLSLHAHLIHFTHYGSIHHFALWRKNLFFFPPFLFKKKKKTRNSIFHFSSLRLSSLSQLLHSPVDPILKLEPICFIFSWSSWQGPFCWRTTLSTQTRSPCTSRASSALTKLTPSRTQDQKKTARLHLSSSTLSPPPYPL